VRHTLLAAASVATVFAGTASARASFSPNDLPIPQPKLILSSTLTPDGLFSINFTWPDFDRTGLCDLGWEEWYGPAVNGPVGAGDLPLAATAYTYQSPFTTDWEFVLTASTCADPGAVYEGGGVPLTNQVFNQTSLKYGPGWITQAATDAYGSDQTFSTKRGASATITKTFANFGLVAGEGPHGGTAAIYVDGVKKANISLYSRGYKSRQIVWKIGYPNNQKHTIKVVNTSATTTNRVTLDAVVTLTRCESNCGIG
jgi:hypothetical protein